MAFVVEGLLFAFHLEGSELNWKAHLLLVMSILAAVGTILGEIAAPGNVLLGLARAQLVMLQGGMVHADCQAPLRRCASSLKESDPFKMVPNVRHSLFACPGQLGVLLGLCMSCLCVALCFPVPEQ